MEMGRRDVTSGGSTWNGSLLKWYIYYIEKEMKKSGKT
jgi:hypothetical protein